jgi:hypothetical protein
MSRSCLSGVELPPIFPVFVLSNSERRQHDRSRKNYFPKPAFHVRPPFQGTTRFFLGAACSAPRPRPPSLQCRRRAGVELTSLFRFGRRRSQPVGKAFQKLEGTLARRSLRMTEIAISRARSLARRHQGRTRVPGSVHRAATRRRGRTSRPVAGRPSPQRNDIDVNDRGLIYFVDRVVRFDIAEPRRQPDVCTACAAVSRRSFIGHSGLAQTDEKSGFEQGADLRHPER